MVFNAEDLLNQIDNEEDKEGYQNFLSGLREDEHYYFYPYVLIESLPVFLHFAYPKFLLTYIESCRVKEQKKVYPTKTYIVYSEQSGLYKIGKTTHFYSSERHTGRLTTLQVSDPSIIPVAIFEADIETQLHRKYHDYRKKGEWFSLSKETIEDILRLYKNLLSEYHTEFLYKNGSTTKP